MATKILERELSANPIITEAMEQAAHEAGIKLEYVNGIPVWEASPVIRHQSKTLEIQFSMMSFAKESGCDCIPLADISIRFPDGSLKRPDISVYCAMPPERDTSTTQIPEAVIEIISKGYEKKDSEISLPFYLAQRIADIALFDPATNRVAHYQEGKLNEYDSPVELTFACGCRATI